MRARRQRTRTVIGVWFLASLLGGCFVQTHQSDDSIVDWDEIDARSLLNGSVAAIYLSTDVLEGGGGEDEGVVAFVDEGGSLSGFRTAKLDNGTISASESGHIGVATESFTYLLSGASAQRHRSPDSDTAGHWGGFTSDGTHVSVLNSGDGDAGYGTDIRWFGEGSPRRTVVNAVPGPVGLVDDVLYLVGEPDSADPVGRNSLYAARLDETGSTEKVAEWQLHGTGSGVKSSGMSDLFYHAGSLYFLEDTYVSEAGSEDAVRTATGRSTLRLASIDVRTFTYRSTPLAHYPHESIIDTGNGWSPLAQSALGGFESDGKIYTIDFRGDLLEIDLASRRLEKIGPLSASALGASEVTLSAAKNKLLVVISDEDESKLEIYDLPTASLEKSILVPDLEALKRRNPSFGLWSVALLPDSSATP